MIEQAYLYLILIGSTIGAVVLYLWRQTREVNRISLALIRLNEHHCFDTLAFLRGAWSLLSQAGLRGLAWQIDWFGIPVVGQAGRIGGHSVYKEINLGEMRLAVHVYQDLRRGEQRYFNETLIETFLLLLRTDMSIKAGASDAAFTQMAKLNLFLQHDIKNIAQFIQLMADQLSAVPAGKEAQVLAHLRKAAPLVRQRADRIVQTLTLGQHGSEPARTLDLGKAITRLCELHKLDHAIAGMALVHMPENVLDSALDNILKNYTDLRLRSAAVQPRIQATIENEEGYVSVTIEAANSPSISHLERLFEPFWSSDPAGLGIGLYQAKHILEACQGSLLARNSARGVLQFELRLPRDGG